MTDTGHDHGHHDPGGHELEAINTKLLFRLLVSLSFVTFLAAVAVVQWFYSQRRELENQYAAEGSYLLTEYKTKMGADLEGIDRVAANLVGNPALLQAPPPPAGWIHPDDLVGGGAAAPAEEPKEEVPKREEPKPELVPNDDLKPTDAPAEGEPAEGEPADDKPANDKPADDKPVEKPADDKPADDGDN
jgi:hypothetical protein